MDGMEDPFATAIDLLQAERPARGQVERALHLLQQASAEGHAHASERCALFAAFGMAGPPSWDAAIDLLELAARQGSRVAQEQLLLLSDSSRDPEVPENADEAFWKRVRGQIEINARMSPGIKTTLSESPLIRFVRGFATAPECRWLIQLARHRLSPAIVFDNRSGQQTVDGVRDNSCFALGIGEMNVLTEVIRNRISAATRVPVPLFEPSQLLHYDVGQSFKPHYDFLDPTDDTYRVNIGAFSQRIATFLIYLNDGYSGGDTSFPAIGLNVHAATGDALFFANVNPDGTPDRGTLHAGLPPTSGEKWVFSQWIRDRVPAG